MANSEPSQSQPMADLFESAVATAHPDRVSKQRADHSAYRLPLDRLADLWPDSRIPDSVLEPIRWTPALSVAYQDGYDPLLWIDRGASAEVWRCVDRSLGREVAIKIPCIEPGQDVAPAIAALQDEAELLGRLKHPGIVHAVRRGGDGPSAYLAMDFIDGDDIVQHCTILSLDARACLELFSKSLDAVAYLHKKEVVHGDIKPEHILVGEDNQPVLIDFGLSSYDSASSLQLNNSTRLGGSGKYRAPEIASGAAANPDPSQDVYSLGIMLRDIIKDKYLDPIGDQINSVIDRAIEREPRHRWQDAGVMRKALREALSPPRPSEHGDSDVQSEPRASHARHSWRLPALAVTLFLPLLALIWIFVIQPNWQTAAEEGLDDDTSYRAMAQASVIELALGNIYAGNNQTTPTEINKMIELDPNQAGTWEMRHLESMVDGKGESYPLGRSPYGAAPALCTDFDPTTNTVVYVVLDQGRYQLWFQSIDFEPILVGESVQVIRSVAISPGAEKIASIDTSGRVKLWPIDNAAGKIGKEIDMPKQVDARMIWFGPDQETLCFFSPNARTVECWSINLPIAAKPLFSVGECDHVYLLPSGGGSFLTATRGEELDGGFTELRLINTSGKVIRHHELATDQLPVSADTRPGPDAMLCLGMPDGYVWIHNPLKDGRQIRYDLGQNAAVTSVLYSEKEKRVFASQGRVHVIDWQGNLLTRLGDRKSQEQLITELSFEDDSDTLTVISTDGVRRCLAE